MDPDICLRDCRSLAEQILAEDDDEQHSIESIQLAECFQSLDEWIQRKGFLPEEWRK